jgi:uncharacterized protein (TIGR02145 family)
MKLIVLFLLVTLDLLAQIKDVKIGKQVWMIKNLNVSSFRNGDAIPQAKTDAEWEKAANNKQPAWCFYENDSVIGAKYGMLYNWYAVNDPRGLAPVGYHIPSHDEWTKLIDYLGGENGSGTKMKSKTGWDENGNGNNTSGFSGLPGGIRYDDGIFDNFGGNGFWWSSTAYNISDAWYTGLDFYSGDVFENDGSKQVGFSVRCLRDY